MNISKIVNTDLYPIDKGPEDSRFVDFAREIHASYQQCGIVTLPGFLRSEAIAGITKELNCKSDQAFITDTEHNVYLDDGHQGFPPDHIRNKALPTKVASLAFDLIDNRNALRLLYNYYNFREFLRLVLGQQELHQLDDPVGACSINILKSGWYDSWHFDQSNFSTTIMLQKPKSGGDFQLTQPIKGAFGMLGEKQVKKY